MDVAQIQQLPPSPSRSRPGSFSVEMDALLAALPGFVADANALAVELTSRAMVVAASNYVGVWSELSGPVDVPASVSHAGTIWVLLTPLEDVTASEPASDNPDWLTAFAAGLARISEGEDGRPTWSGAAWPAGILQSLLSTGGVTITGVSDDELWAKHVRAGDDTLLEEGGDYSPTGGWDFSGGLLTLGKGHRVAVVEKGDSGTETQTYSHAEGSVQAATATGDHTIAFSDWPPAGRLAEMLLLGSNFGAYTLSWPTIYWVKPDGGVTTSIVAYLAEIERSLQTSGLDQFILWTSDGGTVVYGKLI